MTNPTPADLARTLAELRTRHLELTDTVEHLVDALETLHPSQPRTEPGEWSWQYLDTDRATTLRHQLHDFVTHINTREELPHHQHIPPCWHHHGRAVEDLTALYAAWQDAYYDTNGPTSALIHYRDRWLWPTLTRLTDTNTPLRRCIDKNQHTPWYEPTTTDYLDTDGHLYDRSTQLTDHVTRDITTRPHVLPDTPRHAESINQ
ncbi:DUF4913 domain-containing protein [Actinosynnema sp. NPDC047251]|uniref:DUF4913 domain-containing protein n=1 Tax=Saccharothrix espanaensis (strain ATCC 51144 / DSM 44229 / JCM 9112 / NBRC 15066 / NRRL 15764) TaxID=1179773 RepID=K0JTN4_SACES|nr:DUF4913 domain-containing protein [Saccharothrix espanaensis]CCH29296.1 hypothetical protein BN6_19760 [Saccharothrix espanaensis DSM 44229]